MGSSPWNRKELNATEHTGSQFLYLALLVLCSKLFPERWWWKDFLTFAVFQYDRGLVQNCQVTSNPHLEDILPWNLEFAVFFQDQMLTLFSCV